MRSISISMTIAHPAAQVRRWTSGALRAITVGAENARSRVLAGPRDSGRHFVSKCSHCACSVSHERGPNERSYVKSPPPPPHARRTFFTSVIQPDLEYAALTFTPSMNAGLRNRLLAVWRKASRCAAGVGYQDEVTTPLLSEFRLTNIVDRWIVQFACYVRQCAKQETPSTSCAKLQRPAHRHRTRGQENSFRPFPANNRAGLVFFSNRAPLLWNSLPVDVREALSPSSFKGQPPHCDSIAEKCISPPSEDIFSSHFQHW